MINIVIPISAKSKINSEDYFNYPLPLIDIYGKSLIEYSLQTFDSINDKIKFTFILREEDCENYNFDNSLKLLKPDSNIVRLKNTTQGAICSILMTLNLLNDTDELIVANYDQLINANLQAIINKFRSEDADGGLITFNSIHPRWSYARVINDNDIIQTAEKNPISNYAIAGFYYFKKFNFFKEASFDVIRNNENYQGKFFTSSTFNQMVLKSLKIKNYTISNNEYFSFYSEDKLKEFKEFLKK